MQFRSVDAALRWAYAMEGRAVLKGSQAFQSGRSQATAQRLWDGWTTWERHAQAAMVRAQAERQASPLDAFVVACYARIEMRLPAAQALVWWVAPERVGSPTAAAYELMVEQYVLGAVRVKGGGIGAIRRELGCRKLTALDERRRVFALLDGLRARLFDALAVPLSDGGLLAPNA